MVRLAMSPLVAALARSFVRDRLMGCSHGSRGGRGGTVLPRTFAAAAGSSAHLTVDCSRQLSCLLSRRGLRAGGGKPLGSALGT